VPEADLLLAVLPAEEDRAPLELRGEVHEPLLVVLHLEPEGLELVEAGADAVGRLADLLLERRAPRLLVRLERVVATAALLDDAVARLRLLHDRADIGEGAVRLGDRVELLHRHPILPVPDTLEDRKNSRRRQFGIIGARSSPG
jgi:hypothetical protein